MKTSEIRNYSCKDEELPVVCRNALVYVKRDSADFFAFSPLFDEDYLKRFGEKIDLVDELVSPKTETEELKKITKQLYQTLDSLLEPVARIRGYLLLAKDSVDMSAKNFGLAVLSRKIMSRDAEGARQNLLLVISYLKKYQEELTAVGFSDTVITQMESAVTSIANDNQRQFEIVSNRKSIVQNNMKVLNELYKQLIDLLNVGKLLYKTTDPVKAKEYTFSALKKSVRKKP
ncbi:MAG: hypothetical protein LBC19_14860 [Tannerella sp.]|jgi:hypothetical protein|nr:hypothetical protein [Tannerella sp.]